MDKRLFKELDANLQEAVKIAQGKSAAKTAYVVLTPARIKAIRANGTYKVLNDKYFNFDAYGAK